MRARALNGEAQGEIRVTGCNHNEEQPPTFSTPQNESNGKRRKSAMSIMQKLHFWFGSCQALMVVLHVPRGTSHSKVQHPGEPDLSFMETSLMRMPLCPFITSQSMSRLQVLNDILPGDDGKHCECQVTPGTPFYQGPTSSMFQPVAFQLATSCRAVLSIISSRAVLYCILLSSDYTK